VRWERIAFVLLGLAVLAVVAVKLATGAASTAATKSSNPRVPTAAEVALDQQANERFASPKAASSASAPTPSHRATTAPAAAKSHSATSHPQAAAHGSSSAASHASSTTSAARHATASLRAAPVRASARATPRRVAGGGAAGSGQLPRTGAPVWLAGVLGALLVLAGLSTHFHAVRIGAVAMLYRRGPALRPIESGRSLADRFVALVDAPAPAGDFTTTRLHRAPRR
jgi:hypothetical protein